MIISWLKRDVAALKRWMRCRSASAPQMMIKRQLTWPWRAVVLLLLIGCMGGIGLGAYSLGLGAAARLAGQPTLQTARAGSLPAPVDAGAQAAAVQTGADTSGMSVAAADSQINIARSAQRQLVTEVKALAIENAHLKEDLAFFEGLLPTTKIVSGISISRLTADIAGPNQVRYRLLVMQGGKDKRDFNGSVQLAATVLQNGKSAIINFPDAGSHDPADTEKFHLAFKRYQRIEGLLTLPDGTEIKSIQARVLEKGQLRAQQTTIVERNS